MLKLKMKGQNTLMRYLSTGFDQAIKSLKTLKNEPTSEQQLKLYALFKQANKGPCNADDKPGMFDFVATSKYQAWMKVSHYNLS